jgi:DNA-binding beta-propeller fold protein YncE
VGLGLFPATADVTPDGNFLFAVNFNLHGDPVPSSVSVVDTSEMVEVARIPTCIMPHGSRISRDGRHQYSACMMNDLLVEVDTEKMKVSRSFRVSAGKEAGYPGLPQEKVEHHEGMPMNMAAITCSPTWAQPSSDGSRVYVACNKSNEIVEVDTKEWRLVRRIPAGNGVYNLGVTSDGKLLLATNKRDASVSIFDAASAKELARLPTKRKVVHGVVVSPDNLFAFFTVEGIGEQPGTVEVVDLEAKKIVAEVDTPPQAAGIDFWKME